MRTISGIRSLALSTASAPSEGPGPRAQDDPPSPAGPSPVPYGRAHDRRRPVARSRSTPFSPYTAGTCPPTCSGLLHSFVLDDEGRRCGVWCIRPGDPLPPPPVMIADLSLETLDPAVERRRDIVGLRLGAVRVPRRRRQRPRRVVVPSTQSMMLVYELGVDAGGARLASL